MDTIQHVSHVSKFEFYKYDSENSKVSFPTFPPPKLSLILPPSFPSFSSSQRMGLNQEHHIYWELVKNANSLAPPMTHGIRNTGGGANNLCFNMPSRRF